MPANKTSKTANTVAAASTRRGYRRNMGRGWLMAQAARCFRNFVRNWKEAICDSDVFNLFYTGPFEDPDVFEALLLRHFPLSTLEMLELAESDAGDGEEPPKRRSVFSHPGRRHRMHTESSSSSITLLHDIPHVLLHLWNRKALRRQCRVMLEEGCGQLLAYAARADRRHSDPMETRAAEIVSFLGLDAAATDVFTVAVVRAMSDFRDLPLMNTNFVQRTDFIAMTADRPLGDVARALRPDAPLRRYEVLDSDADLASGPFRDYLENGGDTLLEGHFYRPVSVADALPLSHHGALADAHAPLLKALLSAAPSPSGRAPSILFYGPPGTGKTSFAKTLARELSLDLVEILLDDGKGHVSPAARLNGLRLCHERLPAGRTLVLVDEADAILQTNGHIFASLFGSAPTLQKGILNASLDGARLPTVWIANTPAEALDESVRRRFDYSIRFEALDAGRRLAIWNNNIDRLGLGAILPADIVHRLAARYPTNAGGIATALENVRRLGATPDRAEALVASLLEPHCALLGIGTRDGTAPASANYTTDGLNIAGAVPPEQVVAAVRDFRNPTRRAADPDRPRLNILLYGPPGTGKTEFVRHLARETGAELHLLTGASLLDPYVGGTEARIRDAFRDARAANAILFLDELDGLLMERASARQRWELTQVNELLHEMEEFDGIFLGATNYMDRLDPAVLRRFTLKLRFDYLTPEGKRRFYARMFPAVPLSAPDALRLAAIPNLTPGDFRTVRQSLHWLGGGALPPTSAILAELEKETALKREASASRPFGFA